MLKTLDRYIIRKFLVTYCFVVLLIVSIVCVIDLAENNIKYLEHNAPFNEILGYYGNFAIWIANYITPLTIFIASVFVTSQLAGRTEVIAILSSGVSYPRLVRPYIIGSVFVAVLSFYMNGWVIPDTNKERLHFENEYRRNKHYFSDRDVHIKLGPSQYLYIKTYRTGSDSATEITLEEIEGNKLFSKLSARRMEWQTDTNKWRLKDWRKTVFDGKKEIITQGNKLDTALNISPKYFASKYRVNELLTMKELNAYIDDLKLRGAENVIIFQVEKITRYTAPFAILILTFMGVVVASKKSRQGAGVQIATGFVLAFVYIIFFTFSRTLAESKSMNAYIAVWLPNIIFMGIGVYLYFKAPK